MGSSQNDPRCEQCGCLDCRCAAAPAESAQVPSSFVLVPVEPTPQMIEAGNAAAHAGGCDLWQLKREVMNAWPAMLAAAPVAHAEPMTDKRFSELWARTIFDNATQETFEHGLALLRLIENDHGIGIASKGEQA